MDLLHRAFYLLRELNYVNSQNTSAGMTLNLPAGPRDLQRIFQELARWEDLNEVFEIGEKFGFSRVTIVNILILHGGYFRLLAEAGYSRSKCRFIDSLYHSSFPSLNYVVQNKDILAPWVTLGAQEALLDMPLSEISVIEYGSGISTFFFVNEALECISFESGSDPAGQGSWSDSMNNLATREEVSLRLVTPNGQNDRPVESLGLIQKSSDILVVIDGEERVRHFEEWGKYILSNKTQRIALMLDNSEGKKFTEIFEELHHNGATIVHHYGSVYGQLLCKQCTSFVTFSPSLLVAKAPAPFAHDMRWGRMNMQS